MNQETSFLTRGWKQHSWASLQVIISFSRYFPCCWPQSEALLSGDSGSDTILLRFFLQTLANLLWVLQLKLSGDFLVGTQLGALGLASRSKFSGFISLAMRQNSYRSSLGHSSSPLALTSTTLKQRFTASAWDFSRRAQVSFMNSLRLNFPSPVPSRISFSLRLNRVTLSTRSAYMSLRCPRKYFSSLFSIYLICRPRMAILPLVSMQDSREESWSSLSLWSSFPRQLNSSPNSVLSSASFRSFPLVFSRYFTMGSLNHCSSQDLTSMASWSSGPSSFQFLSSGSPSCCSISDTRSLSTCRKVEGFAMVLVSALLMASSQSSLRVGLTLSLILSSSTKSQTPQSQGYLGILSLSSLIRVLSNLSLGCLAIRSAQSLCCLGLASTVSGVAETGLPNFFTSWLLRFSNALFAFICCSCYACSFFCLSALKTSTQSWKQCGGMQTPGSPGLSVRNFSSLLPLSSPQPILRWYCAFRISTCSTIYLPMSLSASSSGHYNPHSYLSQRSLQNWKSVCRLWPRLSGRSRTAFCWASLSFLPKSCNFCICCWGGATFLAGVSGQSLATISLTGLVLGGAVFWSCAVSMFSFFLSSLSLRRRWAASWSEYMTSVGRQISMRSKSSFTCIFLRIDGISFSSLPYSSSSWR